MIDKVEFRVPYGTNFTPDFRFVPGEIRYAGFSSTVKRSQYYQGVCDLRPFKCDAILHAFSKSKGSRSHKLEILESGKKSLDQIGHIVSNVFDIDPGKLELTRIDFAADMYGIHVIHLDKVLRVKFKRSFDERGEFDYAVIGARTLEYVRYGKSPNCLRIYDKPAECLARFPMILKQANADAEPPSFLDVFGFSEDTVMTRVERQSGGGRVPKELATFRQLYAADEFNPYESLLIVPGSFSFPAPKQCGDARSLKLAGIQAFVDRFGYQRTRAMLNTNGNAKRLMDDYEAYLSESAPLTTLTLESILESYRSSVRKQIDGVLPKV